MANMWRFFRESGPRPPQDQHESFTMEIHHGGYFDSMPDGTKKYKIARLNKLGGVCYLDGLDADELALVEFNNIAWELGYREKPISYHYKLPGTLSCEGWVPIKNDADAVEMTKMIPRKKRQISIYITGGGKRKKKEAEMDDECPRSSNWCNPLNDVGPRDEETVVEAAHLIGNRINSSMLQKRVTKNIKATYKEKGKAVLVEEPKEHKCTKKRGRKPQGKTYNTITKEHKSYEKVDDSSSGDSDFYIDSDYEQTKGDDDIDFDENVTNPSTIEEYEEMGFMGVCSDDEDNSDEFASWDGSETEEGEDGNPLPKISSKNPKTKAWNRAVDLDTPNFCVGQAFTNSEVLKEAVREYCIVYQRGLWFQKNSKIKIEVRCQWGCPFWLYASRINKEDPTMYIKTLRQAHKCHVIQKSHHLNCNRVAREVQEDLMVDTEWSRTGIQNRIQKKYKLDVSVKTIYRGKLAAKRMNEGHYLQQYNKLASYRKELLRSNPGSTVEIKTQMDGEVRRFHRMYVCLAACKEGWIKGCRPLIGLDGCHIKGQHPGQILCAVGIDANNGIFPIAYSVVEVENTETWKWFLEYLIWDLKMENPMSYTFITDKQKGLGIAIADLMLGAEHRHCVRHLYKNFKCKHPGEGLKQTLWNAARSTTHIWFNRNMEAMEKQSDGARKWFEDKPPEQWSRSHFRTTSKCDILLNNLCESWNASLVRHRDKPILTVMEGMRMDSMTRMANRRVASTRWTNMVGPRIAKIIEKIGKRTHEYRAHMSGDFCTK
ncbi:uncharacterized protein LOC112195847 [Rosa chinensis]|uniref:uncharacterized protein LOC112195847 n=1 Tax=Rosa chinensis TaxID=74649 RepID=UPI001AD94EFF|nr:uncharacterized protein LOC112195847 [Rosa chinensis]